MASEEQPVTDDRLLEVVEDYRFMRSVFAGSDPAPFIMERRRVEAAIAGELLKFRRRDGELRAYVKATRFLAESKTVLSLARKSPAQIADDLEKIMCWKEG